MVVLTVQKLEQIRNEIDTVDEEIIILLDQLTFMATVQTQQMYMSLN